MIDEAAPGRGVPGVHARPLAGHGPAYFDPQWGETTAGLYGAVRSDVNHLTVRLTDGTTLTLRPVAAFGARLVAFAVPRGTVIASITAYSRTGVIATTTPYYDAAQDAQWDMWWTPGQHRPPRASGRIGSGVFAGQAWSVSASTGPWGVCFMLFGNAMCAPLTATNVVRGRAFFVFATSFSTGTIPSTLHWTAYDAAGHRVAADNYDFS